MPTQIDREKLEYWATKLPDCKRFLYNFFVTCQPFSPEANYLNYLNDLTVYSPTHRHIRENLAELTQALYDIIPGTENLR